MENAFLEKIASVLNWNDQLAAAVGKKQGETPALIWRCSNASARLTIFMAMASAAFGILAWISVRITEANGSLIAKLLITAVAVTGFSALPISLLGLYGVYAFLTAAAMLAIKKIVPAITAALALLLYIPLLVMALMQQSNPLIWIVFAAVVLAPVLYKATVAGDLKKSANQKLQKLMPSS